MSDYHGRTQIDRLEHLGVRSTASHFPKANSLESLRYILVEDASVREAGEWSFGEYATLTVDNASMLHGRLTENPPVSFGLRSFYSGARDARWGFIHRKLGLAIILVRGTEMAILEHELEWPRERWSSTLQAVAHAVRTELTPQTSLAHEHEGRLVGSGTASDRERPHVWDLADKYHAVSEETRRLIERLVQQDSDDRAWAHQIGPVCEASDAAELLGRSADDVEEDEGLLRLEMRSGAVGYPIFQFDGRRVLSGVREVVIALRPAVATTWTIASWLTSPQSRWGGARPLDRLRAGDVEEVLSAAKGMSQSLAN